MAQTPSLELMAREFKQRYWHQNPLMAESSTVKTTLLEDGSYADLEPEMGKTPEKHIQE